MKVLIIDDSEAALKVAQRRLACDDVEVFCARSGAEGLDRIRKDRPDLVLLDVKMPGMSGFDVCREIKGAAGLADIPVIFLSGTDEVQDKVKGLDLGAVDFVTKPFDAFELRARVSAALRTKALQDMLAEQAQIDPLTGLANRRGLQKQLVQQWARMERQGDPLCLIMTDIDHFKQINDTYGHPVGDGVLQAVAGALKQQSRAMDFLARYGGEEFALLAPGTALSDAMVLAERCRCRVEALRRCINKQEIRVTASFGVASGLGKADPEALIAAADQALYKAKDAGRNRVETLEAASATA